MAVCFFIGHRDAPESLLPLLEESARRHVLENGVTEFIVGRYGNYDHLAARAVRKIKQRHPEIQLTLLLAYYKPDAGCLSTEGFDGTVYPDGIERIPKRAAIVYANQYMIKHCDYLIAYDRNHIGNTRRLMAFARKCEKQGLLRIENLGVAGQSPATEKQTQSDNENPRTGFRCEDVL